MLAIGKIERACEEYWRCDREVEGVIGNREARDRNWTRAIEIERAILVGEVRDGRVVL